LILRESASAALRQKRRRRLVRTAIWPRRSRRVDRGVAVSVFGVTSDSEDARSARLRMLALENARRRARPELIEQLGAVLGNQPSLDDFLSLDATEALHVAVADHFGHHRVSHRVWGAGWLARRRPPWGRLVPFSRRGRLSAAKPAARGRSRPRRTLATSRSDRAVGTYGRDPCHRQCRLRAGDHLGPSTGR
jgi:hypothetical protein